MHKRWQPLSMTMKTLWIIPLLVFVTSLKAFSCDFQDSVKVDKKKTEEIIKEIKKRLLENYNKIEADFDLRDVEFDYPDKFVPGDDFDFDIDVKWKGKTILLCDVEVEDEKYKLRLVLDLR